MYRVSGSMGKITAQLVVVHMVTLQLSACNLDNHTKVEIAIFLLLCMETPRLLKCMCVCAKRSWDK